MGIHGKAKSFHVGIGRREGVRAARVVFILFLFVSLYILSVSKLQIRLLISTSCRLVNKFN